MVSDKKISKQFDRVVWDMELYDTEGYEGFLNFLDNVKKFNNKTFGGFTLEEKASSLVKHIRAECVEIEENPTDLDEWIDVVILAMDALLRAEEPHEILRRWANKMAKNASRDWPEPAADKPMFHIKD